MTTQYHPNDDTILTQKESLEIDRILTENVYYDLEDVMTYLRMRDVLQDPKVPQKTLSYV